MNKIRIGRRGDGTEIYAVKNTPRGPVVVIGESNAEILLYSYMNHSLGEEFDLDEDAIENLDRLLKNA